MQVNIQNPNADLPKLQDTVASVHAWAVAQYLQEHFPPQQAIAILQALLEEPP